jgi:hypothetical protein
VVVRKLVDPLPGALSSRGHGGRPPVAWEQAVAAAIDRLARRAARPALETVPADAQAVIFIDTAEWLACLAADWLKGLVAERWWWRSLLRQKDVAGASLAAWLAAPESVPAALRHLADRGQVVAFARALTDPFARGLLDAVVLRFGLSRVREVLDRRDEPPAEVPRREIAPPAPAGVPRREIAPPVPAGAPEGQGATPVEASRARPRASSRPADGPGAPPRLPRAPEAASAGLSPMARVLLDVGLTLARAPSEARSPSFAIELRRLLEAIRGEEAGPAPAGDRPLLAGPRPALPPAVVADTIAGDRPSELRTVDAPTRSVSESSEVPPAAPAPEDTGLAPDERPPATGPDAVPTVEEARTPADSDGSRPFVVPVVTEFGGLFYLINLGLFLGLYGDFSNPAEPGIALDLWDFVAMVGLRLAGESVRDDPVWPLLARLAGRDEREPPGRDFDPGDDWRLPPEWLSAFPEPDCWMWDADGGRLRVRHPQGFLVLDVLLGDAPSFEGWLDEEMRAYSAVALRRGRVPRAEAAGPPVERWLDRLLPYLRARLLRALDGSEPETLGPMLCRARARIFVTADRLDVMLSLEEHPIAIRLAGLDRDPGWVPAAGRFLAFHFE